MAGLPPECLADAAIPPFKKQTIPFQRTVQIATSVKEPLLDYLSVPYMDIESSDSSIKICFLSYNMGPFLYFPPLVIYIHLSASTRENTDKEGEGTIVSSNWKVFLYFWGGKLLIRLSH